MSGDRPYHSPLREAQAAQTRDLILETMVGMMAEGRVEGFSVRRLATEAGVSERTVYRYFPDREALLEGLGGYLEDRMGTATSERDLGDLDELIAFIPVVFASFDQLPHVSKASVLLNPDPAKAVGSQRRRSRMMIDLAGATFPDLDEDQAVRLGQLVRTITSTYNWLRMREEFGLAGEESGRLLGWAIHCILAEVRRTGRVGPPD